MKTFYQCDVAEGNDADGSIWTSSVHYCDSMEEAEFNVMLELQQDWGDGYMPDAFLDAFGSEPTLEALQERDDPEFPGVEAWNAAGYWDDIPAKTGMLTVDTVTALAKLGKIKCDLPSDVIDAALADQAQLHVVVNMREGFTDEPVGPAPILPPAEDVEQAECMNCGWNGGDNELNPIKGFHERVQPGDTAVPAGECPECGCLAYLKEDDFSDEEKADMKHNATMLDGCETDDELNAELRAQTQGN